MGVNLQSHMSIGATGKVASTLYLVQLMARRCIYAQSCRIAKCPTGVSTQDPSASQLLWCKTKQSGYKTFTLVGCALQKNWCKPLANPHSFRPDNESLPAA